MGSGRGAWLEMLEYFFTLKVITQQAPCVCVLTRQMTGRWAIIPEVPHPPIPFTTAAVTDITAFLASPALNRVVRDATT